MVQTTQQGERETSSSKPLVAFLGPPSSFTHQVRVLAWILLFVQPHSPAHSHPHLSGAPQWIYKQKTYMQSG